MKNSWRVWGTAWKWPKKLVPLSLMACTRCRFARFGRFWPIWPHMDPAVKNVVPGPVSVGHKVFLARKACAPRCDLIFERGSGGAAPGK